MKKICCKKKFFKKILSLIIIIILLLNVFQSPIIFAAEGNLGIENYILEVFQSWKNEDGEILRLNTPNAQGGYDCQYVKASEYDIVDIFEEGKYYSIQYEGTGYNVLQSRIRKLMTNILDAMVEQYHLYSNDNENINVLLYNVLYDILYNEGTVGQKYSLNDISVKYSVSNKEVGAGSEILKEYTITDITFKEGMLEEILIEYSDIKANTEGKTNEEIFIESEGVVEEAEGVYKYEGIKDSYICTVNVAITVWDEAYIKDLIQGKAINHGGATQYMKWEQMFEDYGDDISVMGVIFSQLTAGNIPTGEVKDVYINYGELIDHEKYDTTEKTTYYQDIEDSSTLSKLGGILLEPVFALINFVADAIISNLDTIMTEGDASFSSVLGIGVMQKDPVAGISGKEYYTHIVNMEKLNIIGDVQYPNIRYTPEEIFLGKIDLLSIDFISGKNYEGDTNESSGWLEIRKVISQWYQVLRMVAIIGLLSVLIYTGIKVMISANAKDKAKYKEWIMDWFMAGAILFSMHLIMAFIVSVTGEFSKLIGNSSKGILINGASASNLIGLVRFMIQAEDFYMKIGYEVMYIALIWYTLKFTFVYLKRVLNMAFLTLIAPIVALTYTLDKINDGKAQGFEMWLKEYIFNALLQPMHCILYYVFVGSAVQLAASNPIYGIVVLAFMAEAEKLLKKIFGFDKASGGTVGGMAGAFAAGAVASNIAKLAKGIGGGKGGNGNKGDDGVSGKSPYDNPKPLNNNQADDDALFSGNNGDNGSNANDDESDKTAQQRMFDADEENGEFDDDPAYREQMAREAYGEQDGNNMTDEERREMLREQGWSEEDINDTLGAPPQQSTQAPIHQVANNNTQNNKKRSKFAKGAKAVGKKLLKPVWDTDHGAKYNGIRLARKVGRAALGASLGIGAAAVQAGISITDGKYSPFETIASFTGGYAFGNRLEKGVGNGISGLAETYREGRDEGDKEAIMKRAQARWAERDDVIKYNKKYNSEERKDIINVQKQLLEQGITDPKEMDKCIKYMKESGVKMNNASADDIRKARVSHDFSSELSDYGINPFKADDVQKYKATMTKGLSDKDRVAKERLIDNKMNAVREYRTANKPK